MKAMIAAMTPKIIISQPTKVLICNIIWQVATLLQNINQNKKANQPAPNTAQPTKNNMADAWGAGILSIHPRITSIAPISIRIIDNHKITSHVVMEVEGGVVGILKLPGEAGGHVVEIVAPIAFTVILYDPDAEISKVPEAPVDLFFQTPSVIPLVVFEAVVDFVKTAPPGVVTSQSNELATAGVTTVLKVTSVLLLLTVAVGVATVGQPAGVDGI